MTKGSLLGNTDDKIYQVKTTSKKSTFIRLSVHGGWLRIFRILYEFLMLTFGYFTKFKQPPSTKYNVIRLQPH